MASPAPEEAAAPRRWASLERPARILIWVLIILALVELYIRMAFLVSRIFGVLLLFIFAAIVALLLTPVVDRMEATPVFRRRRVLAVLLLLIVVIGVVAGAIALVTPSLIAQARGLPALIDRGQTFITDFGNTLNQHGIPFKIGLPTGSPGTAVIGSVLGVLTGTLATLVNILLVIVISVYLLIQGRQLLATLRRLFPGHEEIFDFTLAAVGTTVGAYARGQLIMSVLMGLYTGIALTIIGVHYAVVLGILTFFLEFLPLVGAPIGMALAVIVALFQGPLLALLAAAVGVGGHALEAYIVGPRITGHVTRLHPLAAMAALLIGAELAGILGALFAIPIAALLNVFLGALYRARQGRRALTLREPGAEQVPLPTLGEEIAAVEARPPAGG